MKKIICFLMFISFFVLTFAQTTEPVQSINWADFIGEILGVTLTIIAIIGRFFVKGDKADILEWLKKIINFILDFLPAKTKDGSLNKFGEPYK